MRKHRFAKPGGGGRTEQPRAFEPGLRYRQTFERAIDDAGEHLARGVEVAGRDGAMTGVLPRIEEPLEHLVDELPLPPRIHHFFVLGLFLEFQHVLREELERAVEIRLDRADRPRARRERR